RLITERAVSSPTVVRRRGASPASAYTEPQPSSSATGVVTSKRPAGRDEEPRPFIGRVGFDASMVASILRARVAMAEKRETRNEKRVAPAAARSRASEEWVARRFHSFLVSRSSLRAKAAPRAKATAPARHWPG